MNKYRIEEKLAILRKRWLKDKKNRDVIELQARVLSLALKESVDEMTGDEVLSLLSES